MMKKIKKYFTDRRLYGVLKSNEKVINRYSDTLTIDSCMLLQHSFNINCNDGKTTIKLKPFKEVRKGW